MRGFYSYNKNNKPNAQTLRKTMTDTEIILWSRIKQKQVCGIQFYRQRSIENFIVDFYAPSMKLVIELDGGQHCEDKHMRRDKQRDACLNKLGITVLRFNNYQIFKQLDAVLDMIYFKIQERSIPPSSLRSATPFEEKGEKLKCLTC